MNPAQLETIVERIAKYDEFAAREFRRNMIEADRLALRATELRREAWVTYRETVPESERGRVADRRRRFA
jgi:hypothetical protein